MRLFKDGEVVAAGLQSVDDASDLGARNEPCRLGEWVRRRSQLLGRPRLGMAREPLYREPLGIEICRRFTGLFTVPEAEQLDSMAGGEAPGDQMAETNPATVQGWSGGRARGCSPLKR